MTSFVYFDLGGVVIKDFSGSNQWTEMKRALGVKRDIDKDFDELYDQYELNELCLTRDVDTLIPIFKKKFDMKFPQGFSMLDYFVKHFERNASIWPVVEKVHKTYGIGLLTNMYPRMFDAIKKRNLLPRIKWNVIVDSSIEGFQKPDPKIYKLAEKKAGVKGKKVLFIDNTQRNTDAASIYGWQTFLYDSLNYEESSRKLAHNLFGK